MKTKIVRIGNSQGVRLPKLLLEQSGLGDEVEVNVEENRIVISPARVPREGWASAFRAMAKHGDDALLDAGRHGSTQWQRKEWRWR